MGTLDILRQKVYGRTWSEQKKNVEAEAWETPRGKGASAAGGKDDIAREQFAAKRLQELGVDRIQIAETHSGGRLSFNPLGRDEQYDRIVPGVKYDAGRRSFLKKALGFGAAGGAILVAANSRGIWDLFTRNAKASPGAAISGPVLSSSGDIDAKRIGGVRYATEFDTAKHAGTSADPFNSSAIQSAISDLTRTGRILLAPVVFSGSTPLSLTFAAALEGISGEVGGSGSVDLGTTITTSTPGLSSLLNINIPTGANDQLTGGHYKDILFDGNANAILALLMTNATNGLFERISCVGATSWGFKAIFNNTHSFIHCQFDKNGTHGTAFPPASGGAQLGVGGGTPSPVNVMNFYGCWFSANLEAGLYLVDGTEINFDGCVIEDNWSYGMAGTDGVGGAGEVCFKSCYWEANQQNGNNAIANLFNILVNDVTLIAPYFNETLTTGLYIQTSSQRVTVINPKALVLGGGPATGRLYFAINGGQNVSYIGDAEYLDAVLVGAGIRLMDTRGPTGWAAATPGVPLSLADQQNTNYYPVLVFITGVGTGITAVGITDPAGTLTSFTLTGAVGQFFRVEPAGKIRLTYTGSPTWKWYGL